MKMSKKSQTSADSDSLLTINFNATRRERKLKRYLKFLQMSEKGISATVLGAPDLTIRIKNDSTDLHSLLLSVHCFEFSKWLERHKCYNLPASIDLTLTRLSKDGLRKMIEYMYDEGEIQMDSMSAEATLIAASYFRMVGLRKLIEQYSLQLVAERTTFLPKWLEIADLNEVDPIYKNDLHYIASRDFQTLMKLKDASRLPDAVMIDLLHREDLNISSEFDLYEFVLRWLYTNRNQEGRRRAFQILSAVRFSTMSTESKFKCLDMAEEAGLLDLVKPHIVMSDWQKTCENCNHPYDTDLVRNLRRNVYPQPDNEQRCPWSREPRFPKPMVLTKTPSGNEIFKPRATSNPSPHRRADKKSTKSQNRSVSEPRRSRYVDRAKQDPLLSESQSYQSPTSSQRRCPSPPSTRPVRSPSTSFRQTDSDSLGWQRRSVKSPPNPKWLSKSFNKQISPAFSNERNKSSFYCNKPSGKNGSNVVCFVSSLSETGKSAEKEEEKVFQDVEVKIDDDAEDGNVSNVAVETSDEDNDTDADGKPLCLHITTKEVNQQSDGYMNSKYKRYDARKNRDPCSHPDKWIPKPTPPKNDD